MVSRLDTFEPGGMTTKVIRQIGFGEDLFHWAERAEYECFGVVNDYLSEADIAAGSVLAYAGHRASTRFFVITDGDALAGTCRVLRHASELGWNSFTTPRDFRNWPVGPSGTCHLDADFVAMANRRDPATVAELATLALMPGHRGITNLKHLLGAAYEASLADGVELWTMALVEPVLRMLQRLFPGAISVVGSMLADYIGADSWPCTFDLYHPVVQRIRDDYHRKFRLILRDDNDAYDIQPLVNAAHGQPRTGVGIRHYA